MIYSPLTNWDEPASSYTKRPICRFCLLNIMIFHSKPLVYWRVSSHLGDLGVSENGVYLPHAHFDRNIIYNNRGYIIALDNDDEPVCL